MASFRDLDIYKSAFEYAIDIHRLSMKLPNFHLETIIILYPELTEFREFIPKYQQLGKMINKFIRYVEEKWNDLSEPEPNPL